MKVIHTVADLHRNSGGPSRTVVELVNGLSQVSDGEISILYQERAGWDSNRPGAGIAEYCVSTRSKLEHLSGLAFRQMLRSISDSQRTIIHNHGIWLPVNHWAVQVAKSSGAKFVLHPRGMLEEWSLSHNRLRKQIAMALFQRRDLEQVDLFVATSEAEMESIRKIGLCKPVALIPNGIKMPATEGDHSFKMKGETRFLFLGRIHRKKGLDLLVNALSGLDQCTLTIAGPDDDGSLEDILALVKKSQLQHRVSYCGPVGDSEKSKLFADNDVLVLPSRSENFGVVVLEALAHGLPVIASRGTPWEVLEACNCGWWAPTSVSGIRTALVNALKSSSEELKVMGASGRELARKYRWEDIATQTLEAYQWLLGEKTLPSFVSTEHSKQP